jgi:hypothetical protein
MDLRAQVEGIIAKILGSVEALATQVAGGTGTAALPPDQLERQCRDLGLAVGHALLEVLWAGYGTGDHGPQVRCPCGGTRRRQGVRARTLRDLMNRTLTVERVYSFCARCGQGWLPLEEALGLPRGAATPALFEVAVTCGSVVPPEEAADLLARVAGVTLSAKSIERYTKAAGQAVEQAVDGRAQAPQAELTPAPPEPPASSARPYTLQFDGSMLRMRGEGFREVKVGCLFDARELAEVRAGRREVLHKHTKCIWAGPSPWGTAWTRPPAPRGSPPMGAMRLARGTGRPGSGIWSSSTGRRRGRSWTSTT